MYHAKPNKLTTLTNSSTKITKIKVCPYSKINKIIQLILEKRKSFRIRFQRNFVKLIKMMPCFMIFQRAQQISSNSKKELLKTGLRFACYQSRRHWVLTNPIDYLLALLIIYYNIKMIVELFYLLAFIVGLGAVFVFLVLGQNKKEDDRGDTLNKILAHKNIHNIFKQQQKQREEKKGKVESQEKEEKLEKYVKEEIYEKEEKEQKEGRQEKSIQEGKQEKSVKVEKNEQEEKEQQQKEKQQQQQEKEIKIEIFTVERQQDTASVIFTGEKESLLQSIPTENQQQNVTLPVTQQICQTQFQKINNQEMNFQSAANSNLPEITEVCSVFEEQSKGFEESEIIQNHNIDSSLILMNNSQIHINNSQIHINNSEIQINNSQIQMNNQTQEKPSFIKELNDENYELKDHTIEKELNFDEEQKQPQTKIILNAEKSQIVNQEKSAIINEKVQENSHKNEEISRIFEFINFNKLIDNLKVQQPPTEIQQKKQEIIDDQNVQQKEVKVNQIKPQVQPIKQNQNKDNSYKFQKIQEQSYRQTNVQMSKKRQRNRLQAMKNHYNKIIAQLQNKLEQVCIRNNESFSVGDADRTIVFSQQDSILDLTQRGDQAYFLELKVEQVCTLKEQLKLQQEMITNLLEEDHQLKSKIQTLEQENKRLKLSKILETPAKELKESYVVEEVHRQTDNFRENLRSSEINNIPSSSQNNLYTSHANFSLQRSNIYSSQAESTLPVFSTISMISVIQGAISIGLLNQCRFLNEISKNFAIKEVKKAMKEKFIDSEIIYNNYQMIYGSEQRLKFCSLLKKRQNLIFLLKLQNGRTYSIYIKHRIGQKSNQTEMDEQLGNTFVFADLNKRKSTTCVGTCTITDEALIWGDQELVLVDSDFIYISNSGQGKIINNIQKQLNMFQGEGQILNVEFLYIYVLQSQS